MACINADGTLTALATKLLKVMRDPITPEDAARQSQVPLYRVRSSLREFLQAGLVEEQEGKCVLTSAGRMRIGEPG